MLRLRVTIASLMGTIVLSAGVRAARAVPVAEPSDSHRAAAESAPSPVRPGFEVLASAGYGASTADVFGVEMEPYGTSFGLDLGYVLRPGFRVGANATYGLGRMTTQRRASRFGDDIDLDIDASSLSVGLSLGYDVPLYFLVLRSSLFLGGTFMRWKIGVPSNTVFSEGTNSPSSSFAAAPGLLVLWPHRIFEWGIGVDYFVQANGAVPPGLVGKLVMGAKF